MKRVIIGIALVLTVGAAAQAGLVYTFDTDPGTTWVGSTWSPTGPAGWSGGAAQKAAVTAGGWQVTQWHEFQWAYGEQTPMQEMANSGNGRIDFDLIVDGSSFSPGVATWFQLVGVGNSDGTAGWTQKDNLMPATNWHNADDPTLTSGHVSFSFAEMGWQPGDTWFQLHLGSNSNPGPIWFYLDNVIITPEPVSGMILLGGLGLIARRRRA